MAVERERRPGTSRMHACISKFDWSASSFGEPGSWPKSLCAIVDLMLDSALPMCLAWGPELRLLYNDAYIALLGNRHPAAFGAPMREVFADLWPELDPIVGGGPSVLDDEHLGPGGEGGPTPIDTGNDVRPRPQTDGGGAPGLRIGEADRESLPGKDGDPPRGRGRVPILRDGRRLRDWLR